MYPKRGRGPGASVVDVVTGVPLTTENCLVSAVSVTPMSVSQEAVKIKLGYSVQCVSTVHSSTPPS